MMLSMFRPTRDSGGSKNFFSDGSLRICGTTGQVWLVEQVCSLCHDSVTFSVDLGQCFRLDFDFGLLMQLEARSGGNQMAQNYVFFQSDEVIDFPGDGRFSQHLGYWHWQGVASPISPIDHQLTRSRGSLVRSFPAVQHHLPGIPNRLDR